MHPGFLARQELAGKQKGTVVNDSAYPFRAQQCTLGWLLWHMEKRARASTVWMVRLSNICSPEDLVELQGL
jgi:hypothetical protein